MQYFCIFKHFESLGFRVVWIFLFLVGRVVVSVWGPFFPHTEPREQISEIKNSSCRCLFDVPLLPPHGKETGRPKKKKKRCRNRLEAEAKGLVGGRFPLSHLRPSGLTHSDGEETVKHPEQPPQHFNHRETRERDCQNIYYYIEYNIHCYILNTHYTKHGTSNRRREEGAARALNAFPR